MNGYLMLELARYRIAERQQEARRAGALSALRAGQRQRRRQHDEDLVLPPVPDYVDGAFRAA